MTDRPPAGHFRLLYFASATTFTRKSVEDLPAPLPVANLFSVLEERYKGITTAVLSSAAITVNLDYVDVQESISALGPAEKPKGIVIQPGDEVAIIPPVSAG